MIYNYTSDRYEGLGEGLVPYIHQQQVLPQ